MHLTTNAMFEKKKSAQFQKNNTFLFVNQFDKLIMVWACAAVGREGHNLLGRWKNGGENFRKIVKKISKRCRDDGYCKEKKTCQSKTCQNIQ